MKYFFLDNGAMIKDILPKRGHLKIKGGFKKKQSDIAMN